MLIIKNIQSYKLYNLKKCLYYTVKYLPEMTYWASGVKQTSTGVDLVTEWPYQMQIKIDI